MYAKVLFWVMIGLFFGNGIFQEGLAGGSLPAITGRLGLNCSEDGGMVAIKVEVNLDQALSGLSWYNNDALTVFPRLLVGTGSESGPPPVEEFLVVSEGVQGVSDGWSRVDLALPIGATQNTLYIAFEFPEADFVALGSGGGPAIGFCDSVMTHGGWAGAPGDSWMVLEQGHRFAINPIFVIRTEGMAVKNFQPGQDEAEEASHQPQPERVQLTAGPNPFNPKVEIKFGLPEAAKVDLKIFDVRGMLVKELTTDNLPPGNHVMTWSGRNEMGHAVSSGPYFVRMKTGGKTLTQRLMLVR